MVRYFTTDLCQVSSMGLLNMLFNSAVAVLAGLFGFALLVTGSQQAATGSSGMGTVVALVGIILLVFATRL